MFDEIDFSPGDITYNEMNDSRYLREEDLFQVAYGDDLYVLDLGWYGTEYAIMIIESLDWSKPILERRTKELSDLYELTSGALMNIMCRELMSLNIVIQLQSYLIKASS